MYQIDNSTAAVAQPASTPAGTAGFFTDGNPASGTAATIVPAEWLNAVMMELVNVVTAGGLTPTKNVFDQVAKAIKAIGKQRVILNDTGAANAYAAVNTPALLVGTWVDGIAQSVKVANANTGPSTYSPDGLVAIPIYGLGLQPLQGGELRAGGVATMVRFTIAGVNSGNPICVLLDCFGGAQQIAPATASQHAMQLGQAVGRYLGTRVFTSNGTYTPTAGTTSVVVEVVGGGGGGGSIGATSAGQIGIGGGGGGGGYACSRLTSGFSGVSMTIGAAGASNGNGGTTSFGALLSATGGVAGAGGPSVVSAPPFTSIGGGGGVGSGGNIRNEQGIYGTPAVGTSSSSFTSGGGGASKFGGGGPPLATSTSAGFGSQSYGAGGGGASGGANVGAQAGGAAGQGIIVVHEYA